MLVTNGISTSIWSIIAHEIEKDTSKLFGSDNK